MTEEKVKEIGFVLDREFSHDSFFTKQFKKGVLCVEFTYEGDELVTVGVTILEEIIDMQMPIEHLVQLDSIITANEN